MSGRDIETTNLACYIMAVGRPAGLPCAIAAATFIDCTGYGRLVVVFTELIPRRRFQGSE
jgi:hypothetical protein